MGAMIVSIIILLFILLGGILGYKEGAIKKLVSVIGLILVVILAFTFKNKLSVYFYENLPFINLWGVFKGIQILNVVFYEVLAFVVIASILMIVYTTILSITGLVEKVLKATVILSLPSKIFGFIIGLIESYVWVYIILFVLTLPMINLKDINNSKVASFIIEETPILSTYTSETMEIYDSIYKIIDGREDKTNEELNEEGMDLMLKYNVITVDSAQKLIDKNKVEVKDETFLEKYK